MSVTMPESAMIVKVSPVDFIVAKDSFDLSHFVAYLFYNGVDNLLEIFRQSGNILMDLLFL
jgi:hypothetical protein